MGHGGDFPGIKSSLDMFLDTGYTSAVMANQDGAAGRVAERIRKPLATMN